MRKGSMVGAVVLAAGASTRMGEPKPLLELGDRPLLEHVLARVRRAAVDPIVVVLGHEAEGVRRGVALDGTIVVFNPEYPQGLSTSLRRGVEALPSSVAAFLVVLADQPFVSPSTLAHLAGSWESSEAGIIIPTFRGVRGNPVLIDRSLSGDLAKISGDRGCKAIFGEHEDEILEVPVDDPGILFDVDSRDQLEKARRAIEDPEFLERAVADLVAPSVENSGPVLRRVQRRQDVEELAAQLRSDSKPFALATVVRAVRPTSGKPGYKAIVLATGQVVGWIGGSCSRSLVIEECLAALRDGRPRFLRFSAEGGPLAGEEGVIEHQMECQSGGSMDIYVEPNLPKPRILIVGDSPVAGALSALGRLLNYRVTVAAPQATQAAFPGADEVVTDLTKLGDLATTDTYAVVATMQKYDAQALGALAPSPVAYVALVASRRRGAALLQDLQRRGIPAEALHRVRSPAGLDLAAETPAEIALSIMAEITQVRRSTGQKTHGVAVDLPRSKATAMDVVCGMEVEEDTLLQAVHDGKVYYFCSDSCRGRFLESPDAFLG